MRISVGLHSMKLADGFHSIVNFKGFRQRRVSRLSVSEMRMLINLLKFSANRPWWTSLYSFSSRVQISAMAYAFS